MDAAPSPAATVEPGMKTALPAGVASLFGQEPPVNTTVPGSDEPTSASDTP